MKRKGIDREIVILLISAVVTLSVWVGFDVYRAYTVTVQPADMESYLLDIDPSLDIKTLNILSEKNQ